MQLLVTHLTLILKLDGEDYKSLTNDEKRNYKETLKNHLNIILNPENSGSVGSALNDIDKLINKQKEYSDLEFKDLKNIADACKEYGTLPFSILARHGFIAKSLLQSLVNINIINQKDFDNILNSVKTISSDFIHDLDLLNEKITLKNLCLSMVTLDLVHMI